MERVNPSARYTVSNTHRFSPGERSFEKQGPAQGTATRHEHKQNLTRYFTREKMGMS